MLTSIVVPLVLAASALANVFITYPVQVSVLQGGQQANVSWIDSGSQPSLAEFGLATFGVYAGNANQQTLLQGIASSVNVSNITSLVFTVNPSIGPNGDTYFIRATSQTLKNPNATQYYEEAFSAQFTMTNMTGTFNSTIQAEINGQSTAPIGGPTGTEPAASVTGTASSASPSSSTNGAAKPIVATSIVALAAALVGASLL